MRYEFEKYYPENSYELSQTIFIRDNENDITIEVRSIEITADKIDVDNGTLNHIMFNRQDNREEYIEFVNIQKKVCLSIIRIEETRLRKSKRKIKENNLTISLLEVYSAPYEQMTLC